MFWYIFTNCTSKCSYCLQYCIKVQISSTFLIIICIIFHLQLVQWNLVLIGFWLWVRLNRCPCAYWTFSPFPALLVSQCGVSFSFFFLHLFVGVLLFIPLNRYVPIRCSAKSLDQCCKPESLWHALKVQCQMWSPMRKV